MWTAKNRGRYDRSKLRYPSDLTDDEWARVERLIPPVRRGGNRRHVDVREVMNGIMYVLSTGCQWRAIPKDLPPRSTVHDYLDLWSYDGTLDRIHHMLLLHHRPAGAFFDQLVGDLVKTGFTVLIEVQEELIGHLRQNSVVLATSVVVGLD
jgi:transposase